MFAHIGPGHGARLVIVASVVLAALLAPPSVQPARAQIITVTTTAEAPGASGDCTLGEAIQAANGDSAVDACPAGVASDLIVLAPGAIYTLTSAAADDSAFIIDSAITVQGNGARLARNPLGGSLRFFSLTASSSLTLMNLTLAGGLAQGKDGKSATQIVHALSGGDAQGGALVNQGGALVLDGVIFAGNVAQGGHGGFGYPSGGTTDGGNGGEASGGAVYSLGPVTLLGGGARFTGNQALGGGGGDGGSLSAMGGNGGAARGGAMRLLGQIDTSNAPLTLEANLAQGGNGGSGSRSWGGSAFGGALSLFAPTELSGASLFNNRAQGGDAGSGPTTFGASVAGAGDGGAIEITSNRLALFNSTLVSNTAQGGAGFSGGSGTGGALALVWGSLSLRRTVVLSNTARGGPATDPSALGGSATGGGIDQTASDFSPGRADLDQSALVGNLALGGANPSHQSAMTYAGGLALGYTNAAVTNTTFALNQAGNGGALWGFNGVVTLTHVTVDHNAAATGGGLAGFVGTTIAARNSLISNNMGGNCQAGLCISYAGQNLQYPSSTCGGATVANPLLGPAADHGGQTLTAALGLGSPALDVGDPAYCPPTDQRGQPRPIGAGCDLGAYERGLDLFLPLIRR